MNTHEDFSRNEPSQEPSDRWFGLTGAAFFALIGLWPRLHRRPLRLWALGLSGLLLIVTLLRPSLLYTANRWWTRLGLLLGRIVNPVVTALVFYLVVTPTAFLMRSLGKDPLCLRFDPEADTYWIKREPPGPAAESMARQF